jgi:hypothetical protein
MDVLTIIKWITALLLCLYSFLILQQHYTANVPWRIAFKNASSKIGTGLLIVLCNPVSYIILIAFVAYLLWTLKNLL